MTVYTLPYKYDDGGRSNYFKAKDVRDCVTRAIAIATGKDYKEVYNHVKKFTGDTPRNGVRKSLSKKLLLEYGGKWHPMMGIGTGCKCHLRADEIPMNGVIVCQLSHHLTTVIDGVIHDTFNPTGNGDRCVYGYWTFE